MQNVKFDLITQSVLKKLISHFNRYKSHNNGKRPHNPSFPDLIFLPPLR